MKKTKAKTKWSYVRAQTLNEQRLTTPLTWEELAKQEGMSAAAVKASLQKWIKRAPAATPTATEPQPQPQQKPETDRETFRRLIEDRVQHWKTGYDYWCGVQLSDFME